MSEIEPLNAKTSKCLTCKHGSYIKGANWNQLLCEAFKTVYFPTMAATSDGNLPDVLKCPKYESDVRRVEITNENGVKERVIVG